MAQKSYVIEKLEVERQFRSTGDCLIQANMIFNSWLMTTEKGRYCKKNLKNLTFHIERLYNNKYPIDSLTIYIAANIEEKDYTLYLLKFGGKNNEQ